jgi:hypothetical protein
VSRSRGAGILLTITERTSTLSVFRFLVKPYLVTTAIEQ